MFRRIIRSSISFLILIIILNINIYSLATTVNTQEHGASVATSDVFLLTDDRGGSVSTDPHYEVTNFWVDTNGKANIIWKEDNRYPTYFKPADVIIAGQTCSTINEYTNFTITDSSGMIKTFRGGTNIHYFVATVNLTEEFAKKIPIEIKTREGEYKLNVTAFVKTMILVQHDVNGTITTDWEQTKGTAEIGDSFDISKKTVDEYDYLNVAITYPDDTNTTSRSETVSVTAQEGTTKVMFHYGNSTTSVGNSMITKTGTTDILSYDQTVEYEINYHTEITTNTRDALEISIIDTLPGPIDLTKPYDLDNGRYDATNNTITWGAVLNPIDNTIEWRDGTPVPVDLSNISTTRNISFIYEDIKDKNGQQITNSVTGNITNNNTGELLDSVTDNHVSNINYDVTIIITSEWVDDIEANRPDMINLILRQDPLRNEIISLNKDPDNWTKTLTGYSKYTDKYILIDYQIEEFEIEGYESSIVKTQTGNTIYFTITNTKKAKELELPSTGGNRLEISLFGLIILISSLYLLNINNKKERSK